MASANPFLFTDEDYSPHAASGATVNPFLMGDDDYQNEPMIDNPFLSQTATTVTTSNASNNPFAFDPMDLEPTEAEIPTNVAQPAISDFMTATSTQSFCTTENQGSTVTSSQDFFSINSVSQGINIAQSGQDILINVSSNISPQKPQDLHLSHNNQNLTQGGPQRPPPPKPPKETQDLLMSVMGAMDATSSSLLDKIPPTRTPSPVSMRDLRSPSPTHDATGDLLDVSDSKTDIASSNEDLFSAQSQAAPAPAPTPTPTPSAQSAPPRPTPPMRPPRPTPPQKPPPPAVGPNTQVNSIVPPKPPPPVIPPAPVQAPQKQQDEMMDMFGSEDVPPPPKPPASKADILNLYNVPPKPEPQPDLLVDDLPPMKPEPPAAAPVTNQSTVFASEQIAQKAEELEDPVKTNFISPEPSQNDLQMDNSDSQSKGSVSSVTFNPFAANDNSQQIISPKQEVKQETPVIDNVFEENTQNIMQQPLQNAFEEPKVAQVESNAFKDTQPAQNIFQSNVDNTNYNYQPSQNANTFETTATKDPYAATQDNFGNANNKIDEFDAFAEKFESVSKDENKNAAFDAFSSGGNNAWGNDSGFENTDGTSGFGTEESFDAFLALQEPPSVPQSTPNRISKTGSQESDEDKDFSVFIKPKSSETFDSGVMPVIAPPPAATTQAAFSDPRFNPFDQSNQFGSVAVAGQEATIPDGTFKRTDSQETPPTPLYDEDVSQPLEPFPRTNYTGEGWEMHLRQPNKKKITGQRFWKKIFVKLVYQQDCVLLQLFNQQSDKDPFQELPLQPCYSVSEIGAQQYDQFGKIFTLKLQYIFYKERPGVRPGQVKKAERITNKLSQFAAYAIQGDYQGVKEFGSDLKKLGLPVEHAPQVSQLMKLGSLNYEDLKQFSFSIEEALFKLSAHRDRALHYKMEEVQITLVDELYVEQDAEGHVDKQIARVRLFFLGFLTGMPDIELGLNDMRRQGKEVVGRHDIIPVVTEEWIRLDENVEFHSCVQQDEYERTHTIRFKPPDACYIELMRFRVRPPKNRELPLQLKAQIVVTGTRIELRADVLVPGFASRKLGQIPCEDVMIRFPIPECWIYLFRVEKHFRYGSVKSAHRRTGKIKGIERILGTVETLQENLIEVTSGQAKYEHQHRAIVWRCPRLPKEGQGAYTTHNMVCRIALTSFDQMPEKLAEYCYVEFTMPATQVSHTTCRSVSVQNSDSDEPPEKYVRYLARHEYRVGIEHTEGENPNPYAAATFVKPTVKEEAKPAPVAEESSSDSD